LGGVGVKLETKEPHFVSLGGGRLSVGVSIIPIKRGDHFIRDSLISLTQWAKSGRASIHPF